jgi:hypothetical protein
MKWFQQKASGGVKIYREGTGIVPMFMSQI